MTLILKNSIFNLMKMWLIKLSVINSEIEEPEEECLGPELCDCPKCTTSINALTRKHTSYWKNE